MGTGFSANSLSRNSRSLTVEVGKRLNCPTNVSKDLISCLRERPSLQLQRAGKIDNSNNYAMSRNWGPVIDDVVVQSFKLRLQNIASKISSYDLMIGISTGYVKLNESKKFTKRNRNQLVGNLVVSNFDVNHRSIFSSIISTYTNWYAEKNETNWKKQTEEILDDFLFSAPMIEMGDYASLITDDSYVFVLKVFC